MAKVLRNAEKQSCIIIESLKSLLTGNGTSREAG